MATGNTTTGSLADSLDTIQAAARSRRQFDGVVPQLVDRVELDANTGTTWREILLANLTAQAVTENTVLDNPQQYDDSAITITPEMVQIQTFITDKSRRNINSRVLAKMGAMPGEAMMRKKDQDGLTAMDASTQMGTANTPVEVGDVASARYRITSNATEPGPMPISGVFHGFCIKDFYDDLIGGTGTYPVPDGATATVFQSGFNLPIANVSIFEDGNIQIDSADDAKNFVFSKSAWVLVEGMTIRTETRREPHIGGGGDSLFLTDEYAYGLRSSNWTFEIIGDATAPAQDVMAKAVTDELEAGVVRFRTASASGVDEITRLVSDDEMCFSLREVNKPYGNQGMHRFQELRVVRYDKLVTAYVDLGPSYMFKADPIFIPGGQVVNGRGEAWHTVAELREIAEEFRGRPVFRYFEPSDLQSAFYNKVEERNRKRKNQSTFGRLSQLVRSDV